jgi:hypothetical protein
MDFLEDYIVKDIITIIEKYAKDCICIHCSRYVDDYVPSSLKVDDRFECVYCIECVVNGCKEVHDRNSLFCGKHAFLENGLGTKYR